MSQSQGDLPPGSQENGLPAPAPATEHIDTAGGPPAVGCDYPPQTPDADDGTSEESSSGSSDHSDDEDTCSGVSTPVTETSDGTGEHPSCHPQPTLLPGLTNLGSEDPAATEWVRYLVQAVGRDVLSFRRNTQVSYMVVQRARDMVKAINGYIAQVDDDDSEDGDWTSFFKYSKAIKPLEEILLELLDFTEGEKEQYFAGTASILECISSAERWATNREKLSGALEGFHTCETLVDLFDEPDTDSQEEERRQAQTYDDKTLLRELRDSISALISEDLNRYPSYVKKVATTLIALQSSVLGQSPADWFTVIIIRASMLVEGVLKMVKIPGLYIDCLNHLKSKHVWEAASALMQVLEAAVTTQWTLADSAQTKYDAFVEKLQSLSKLVLPRTYIKLLKEASRIRRPFQARAFALVALCSHLAKELGKLGKSVVTVETVNALEEAFGKASVALQTAAGAVSKLESFDLTDFGSNPTAQAFMEAQNLIGIIFESVNLNDEWTKQQSALDAAVKDDKKQMEKLNKIFDRKPQKPSSKTAKVRVTIHDKLPDGKVLGDICVEEETSTRLLAVRWSVAGALTLKPDVIKRARNAGTFYKVTAGAPPEPLDSHSTLAQIVGSDSGVTLKLVVSQEDSSIQ